MTLDQLMERVPNVLNEMSAEFIRRGNESGGVDKITQTSACFLLGLRSVSLLYGLKVLATLETRDSWDVLVRAFMESTDLLLTFRFNDQGVRNHIHTWCEGKNDNAWMPRHKKVETFLKKLGGGDTELGKRWSAFSALSHPTVHAAKHSAALIVSRVYNRTLPEDAVAMESRVADYIESVVRLIIATTYDFPQWVSLGCDLARMPAVEPFRLAAKEIAPIILKRTKGISLPTDSYRS